MQFAPEEPALRELYSQAKGLRWNPETDIPWERFDPARYSKETREAARRTWSRRAWSVYPGLTESTALLIRFCLESGSLGMDAKLFLSFRPAEEAKQLEVCHLLAEKLGGYESDPGDAGLARASNHPFAQAALDPDVPVEALYTTPTVDAFLRRVELGIADGGYVMITGDPGTGKSAALRLLAKRLESLRDVVVGTVEHPQSRTMDFYRELGDLFSVPLQAHNRWGGFKSLRARWTEHISTTLTRPVLIVDEAQEALTTVFTELRVLASKELDSRQLLCVVLAGDGRLVERLRSPDLLPLGSRIRRRLVLEYASRDELLACLDHLLETAGNPSLMTTELKATLADHAAGNYRVLMNLADELLMTALDRELPRLDEKLYLEAFGQPAPKKAAVGKKR